MSSSHGDDLRTVTVARGWEDEDTVEVPLRSLKGFHTAHLMGDGPRAPLPKPMLAAILSCQEAPDQCEALGHTCPDGECPHHIEVVIPREKNDAHLYADLRGRAGAVDA